MDRAVTYLDVNLGIGQSASFTETTPPILEIDSVGDIIIPSQSIVISGKGNIIALRDLLLRVYPLEDKDNG